MANTYSQIYIQIVFAVRNRQALIHPEWETELYKFIKGTVQKHGQKMIAINDQNFTKFTTKNKPSKTNIERF